MKVRLFAIIIFVLICFGLLIRVELTQSKTIQHELTIIVTKNKFDNAGRLLNISHTGDNKIYADYDIKWDEGNRITDFDFTYLNGPAKKNTSNYSYDKTSQLINASYSFMPNEKYNFDLNGNRKTAEIQGKNESYKTGEYNRLLSDENYRYEYDLEGNRISKTDKDNKTTKYFWDHRNRLTKVETQTETIEYIYDHQNRLVKRTNNQNTTTFIHDDWQIIATLDSTGKLQSRYLWGTKQDELICNNDNWTLNDHLNTIRDIVKSDGNVEFHLEYNAFGKLISETKNDQLLFAYTGKLTDKSSDLQWNINRWYDSNAGRWVNEDPIMFEGKTFNLYDYVANNPMYYIDSWGLVKKTYGPFKPKDRSEKKRINLIQSLLHNAFVDVTYGYKDFVISVTEESVCCKKTLWSPEMYGYKYDFIVSGKISVEALGEIEKRKGIDLILVGASIYAKVGIKGSANLLIDKLQFSYSTCDSVANSHLQSSYKLDINVYAIVGANMKYLNNEIAAIAKISGTVTYSGNLSMTGSFDFPTKKASVRFSTDGLKKQNIQSEIKANLSFNYNDKEYIKELVLL